MSTVVSPSRVPGRSKPRWSIMIVLPSRSVFVPLSIAAQPNSVNQMGLDSGTQPVVLISGSTCSFSHHHWMFFHA